MFQKLFKRRERRRSDDVQPEMTNCIGIGTHFRGTLTGSGGYLIQGEVIGSGEIEGLVVSRLTVTDWEAVPPLLVAEQVKVVPVVSDATVEAPHPVVDVTADSASATVHETDTLLVYHPLFPRVPVTVGVMTGGVLSQATVVHDTSSSVVRVMVLLLELTPLAV